MLKFMFGKHFNTRLAGYLQVFKLPMSFWEQLSLFSTDSAKEPKRRAYDRLPAAYQVSSADKPGFQAITTDISKVGLRLASTQALEVGEEIELNLLLCSRDTFPIRFKGICRWTRLNASGPIEVGLDLSSSNSRSLQVLQNSLGQAWPVAG